MNEKHDEKVLFTLDEKFRFSCHKGLPCFNKCCRDINIFLTPYDVLRMRKGTGLSSQDFLQKYTSTFLGEDGLPLVMLKVDEEINACPFVEADGCGIYADRPWSCRMYPVFPTSSEEIEYLIETISSCHGFKEDKERTIREWKKDQEIDSYDEMNQAYKEITQHDYFQRGNILDSGRAKLIYTACYDLDSFKRFLFQSKFFEKYDVEEEVIEKMKQDDEAVLNFGYRWIKFSLFSEDTLKLKDKDMDKLLQARNKETS
ncbi:MAG: YkgJ family cysteine cluster protein [Syntrophobacteraceae bacterium]